MKIIYSLIISLPICLTALPAWADIAVQSFTSSAITQSVSTRTTSVVVNAGSQLAILACVTSSGGAGIPLTSIVRDGQSFSQIRTGFRAWASANETYAQLYILVNPNVNTSDSVVTWASTANDRHQSVGYLVLTGVMQTTPSDNANDANGSSGTVSVDLTSTVANAFMVDCVTGDHNGGLTTGQTSRYAAVGGTANNGVSISSFVQTSPGTKSMTATQTSAEWVTAATALAPHVDEAASYSSSAGAALLLLGSP